MSEPSVKITTSCAEMPVLNLLRACRKKLQRIEQARERRREDLIETQRQKKPLFGQPYTITREQAIQELAEGRDWHWHLVSTLHGAEEKRVRGLLGLCENTTAEFVLVSRKDFDSIANVYDPGDLGIYTHESAHA